MAGSMPASSTRVTAPGLLTVALLASACGQNQSSLPTEEAMAAAQLTPMQAPAEAPRRPGAVDLGAVTAVVPSTWQQVPASSAMRVAEFAVPGSGGAASLAVFAGDWGPVDDNVARWVGQFSGPDGGPPAGVERRSLVVGEGELGGGLRLVRVAAAGTYTGGMGGGAASAGYRLLGAIVATGDGFHYLKLVGPEATVAEQEGAFDAFLASLRRR